MKKASRDGKKDSASSREKRHKTKEQKREKSHQKSKDQKPREEHKEIDIRDIDFDDETLEALPNHYKPIWCFMDDRKEMIEQIFSTIHESSLQKMMSKEIKNYNMEQIKNMCFEQLTTMSEDHILYILTGGDPDSFVEKSVDEQESSSKEGGSKGSKRKQEDATDSVDDLRKKSTTENVGVALGSLDSQFDEGRSSDALELHASKTEVQSLDEDSVLSLLSQSGANTDLDLLELEMRAKAIRSLLKAKGLPSSDEEDEEATS